MHGKELGFKDRLSLKYCLVLHQGVVTEGVVTLTLLSSVWKVSIAIDYSMGRNPLPLERKPPAATNSRKYGFQEGFATFRSGTKQDPIVSERSISYVHRYELTSCELVLNLPPHLWNVAKKQMVATHLPHHTCMLAEFPVSSRVVDTLSNIFIRPLSFTFPSCSWTSTSVTSRLSTSLSGTCLVRRTRPKSLPGSCAAISVSAESLSPPLRTVYAVSSVGMLAPCTRSVTHRCRLLGIFSELQCR